MEHNDAILEKEMRRIESRMQPQNDLERQLYAIPVDTPLIDLSFRLSPVLEALCHKDEITATLFIDKTVRAHFGLAKSDLKPIHKAYQKLVKAGAREVEMAEKEQQKTVLLDRDINSPEVLAAISEIGIVDGTVLDLVIATYVAAKLRVAPPIWLILVGAPSSFKTELIRLIDLPEIYSLDTLSENAFASGYVRPDGSDPEDLLPLLDSKCFVIKDLTTIFSLKEDTVKKVLGDLTSIFDGKFEKFTATRGIVRYESQFSMIACITPAILSKHHRYMHQLGGRFFFVRIPELTPEALQHGYRIAWDPADRKVRIAEVRRVVSTYCHQVSERAIKLFAGIQNEDAEVQTWINTAAEFIARARGTTVTRPASFENEEGEKIDYYDVSDPQIEQPWRILNQLRCLARVLAAMRGKVMVTMEELQPLKSIALSSMPIDRACVLGELLKEDRLLVREVAERINKSKKTAGRDLKELLTLKLVKMEEVNDPITGKDAKSYSILPEYKAFLSGTPVSLDEPF